jgi:hypothetical protein
MGQDRGMSPPEPQNPEKQKAAPKKQRKSRQDAHHEQIIGALERAIDHYKTAHKERESAKRYERIRNRAERRFNYRMLLVGVLTTIAAFAAAGIATYAVHDAHVGSDKQYTAMIGQLNVMRAEQRPWIKVQPEATGPLIFTQTALGLTTDVPVAINLTNVGKLPAFNVRVEIHATAAYGGSEPIDEVQRKACDFAATLMRAAPQGRLLFPTDSSDRVPGEKAPNIQPPEITKGMALSATGMVGILVYGCALYAEEPGGPMHQTGFIYALGSTDPDFAMRPLEILKAPLKVESLRFETPYAQPKTD